VSQREKSVLSTLPFDEMAVKSSDAPTRNGEGIKARAAPTAPTDNFTNAFYR